ncbi:hypothetical protein CSA56_09965 [candidate division KSB3 bacterium]|uniref:Uncharacterized protein n=1 Tax=candidate division KSB3 bacterium TaxID=2044937 RepID=A0A2G6KDS2_9BACT|nr:MAG: hypothetical protein CSA56_09965 [candidate division KSB3 bacterium]
MAPGDLLIGDRGYVGGKALCIVLDHQEHVSVRFHSASLSLLTKHGQVLTLLEHLRGLEEGQVGLEMCGCLRLTGNES